MNQLATTAQPSDLMLPAEPPEMGIGDYVEILKRRIGVATFAAVLIFLIAAIVAIVLPALYRSTAVILVEEQSIPQEFIKSTITSFADERIQVISQRVLTRTTLLQLVEKYDLYASDRSRITNDEIVERMRKDIKFTPVSADRGGAGGGRVTIAFNIAYVSETPQKAQRVVNELVSLFLNENVRVRQQRTAETSAFLAEESKRLALQLQEMEGRLANFRARNASALPESSQVNAQLAERADSELLRIERELRMQEDRRNFLQSQLQVVPPNLSAREVIGASGERVTTTLEPADRLRQLRVQQTTLSGSYSEAHPDMRRIAREIAALEKEVRESPDAAPAAPAAAAAVADDAPSKELVALRNKLREARERYSDTHPDVLKLQKAVAALERAPAATARTPAAAAAATTTAPATTAAATAGVPAGASGTRRPDNPAYLQLLAALDMAASEARSLAASREEMRKRVRMYATRLESAPTVQREYLDLARDYENAQTKYRDIKAKELEAQVAEELEKDRKGERFSLIEPAQLPERPFKPDRTAILLIGLALALAGGAGIGALREALDFSVKGPRDLARKIPLPILAQVPYLPSEEDLEQRRLQWWVLGIGTLFVIALVLTGIHVWVTRLDTLFYSWM